MNSRKIIRTFIKLFISSMLVCVLYKNTPLENIFAILEEVDLRYLFIVPLLLVCNTVLSAIKWRLFLFADSVTIPLPTLISTYLIGSFCNLFLPSNIGGDSYRIYDIAQKSDKLAISAISVLADRFSGFLTLAIIGFVASCFNVLYFKESDLIFYSIPLFFLLLIIGSGLVLYVPDFLFGFLRITKLDRFDLTLRIARKLDVSFTAYSRSGQLFNKAMGIAFCFQFTVVVIIYLLALSIHAEVAFLYFCAFVPVITFMEAIPITIFGIGIRDFGYVYFFGLVGMEANLTRTLALLLLFVSVSYSLLGGVLYWCRLIKSSKSSKS